MTLANQQQVQQLTQMLSNTQVHGHAHQPAQAAAAAQQQQQPALQQQQLANDYIKAQWEAIKMEKLKIEREREEIARKVLTSLPRSREEIAIKVLTSLPHSREEIARKVLTSLPYSQHRTCC